MVRIRCDRVRELVAAQNVSEDYMIVDDTTLERGRGHSIEATAVHYSGKGKNCKVHGHCIVTSQLVSGDLSLPLDVRLYDKRSLSDLGTVRGKILLACDLVKHANCPTLRKIVFLADSWYFCREMVETVERRGWDWIFAVRSDRAAWFEGERVSVSAFQEKADRTQGVGTRQDRAWAIDCIVPGLGPVRIVLWRLRGGSGKARYLVTNRQDWPPAAVIARYSRRSRIETFYWSCKQSLGLGEYRVRRAAAAISHWQLVFCAYTALVALDRARPKDRRLGAIGRICEWTIDQTFLENMHWAYTRGRMGMPWSLPRCAEEPGAYQLAGNARA